MAKVTLKQEAEEVSLNGVILKPGETAEIEDEATLRRLSRHPLFSVEGFVMTPEDEPKAVPAPSQMSAQHSVPKPGEPLPVIAPPPEGGNGGEEEIPIGGNGSGIEATARKPSAAPRPLRRV